MNVHHHGWIAHAKSPIEPTTAPSVFSTARNVSLPTSLWRLLKPLCYTCRWHQNSSRSCCINRWSHLHAILPWTTLASACRRPCVRNRMTLWPSMDDQLFEHRHSHLRVHRNIRPEAIGICFVSSAHDDLPWRVHRCFHQLAQCMPSLRPSRSTETAVVLRICLQSHSRTVACVVWRTGRRRSRCEVVVFTSRHYCSSLFRKHLRWQHPVVETVCCWWALMFRSRCSTWHHDADQCWWPSSHSPNCRVV